MRAAVLSFRCVCTTWLPCQTNFMSLLWFEFTSTFLGSAQQQFELQVGTFLILCWTTDKSIKTKQTKNCKTNIKGLNSPTDTASDWIHYNNLNIVFLCRRTEYLLWTRTSNQIINPITGAHTKRHSLQQVSESEYLVAVHHSHINQPTHTRCLLTMILRSQSLMLLITMNWSIVLRFLKK